MDMIFFILRLIFDLLNVFSLVYEAGSLVEKDGGTATLILFLILFSCSLLYGIPD